MLALIDTCHATREARGNLCACLEPSRIERLRGVAGDLRLGPGDVLFRAGQGADAVFGLRQGVVMQSRRLADGRRQVVSFHFPGDTIGLTDDTHGCEAVALTRVSLCRIPLAALDEDPALAAQMRRIAERALASALEHALALGRMTAAERVCRFLLETWRRCGRREELHLPMRVADIADHLGLRPETVSRCFSDLRRDGIVGVLHPDGTLELPDPGRLSRLSGQG
ncbi:MAG: Crp/Fnr family transcriptional regulator [Pseudomonadota bacterium]